MSKISPFGEEYLAKLRDGDSEVSEHFTSHFGHLLEIKLRSKVYSAANREDARQETLFRVLATIRDPLKTQPRNLGAFVYAVCGNVLREMFRADSRTAPISDGNPEPADCGQSPEQALLTTDSRRLARLVLREMGQRDRDLLREVFLEERDKDEVCRERGIERDYLRVLLYRAKIRFRLAFDAAARGEVTE